MKGKKLGSHLAAVFFVIALAPIAHAQDNSTKATKEPANNGVRSETDNQSYSTKNAQQDSNDANVASAFGKKSFDSLDTMHRGYLTQADVAADKHLTTNFQSCDKNHDGRLSRDEFAACK